MGGRSARVKGFGYEREIVKEVENYGLRAKRAYGSNGQAMGQHEECDVLIEGIPFQAKRKKSLAAYLKPCEHVSGQVFREDRGVSYVLLHASAMWEVIEVLKKFDMLHVLKPPSEQTADPQNLPF